jgi:hydrogenase maturation protease
MSTACDRQAAPAIWILGYGNAGRGDDGLGPALVQALRACDLPGVTLDEAFQLMVEHAERLAEVDVAVLVDAALSGPAPFVFQAVTASGGGAPARFSTHVVTPHDLVGLAETLYGRCARTFLLGIRGEQFDDYQEGLSPAGAAHLRAAIDFLADRLPRGLVALDAAIP